MQSGDKVALEIAPVAKQPEPKVPADLRQALEAHPPRRRPGMTSPPSRRAIGSSG